MAQNNETRDIMGAVAHMKKNGSLKLLAAVLSVGLILLLIGGIFMTDDGEGKSSDNDDETLKLIGFFEYKELLEREIEGICLGVRGVESVDAVVFFSDVGGSLYAQNTQSSNSNQDRSEYVIIGSGSSAHALYLGESLPKLSGIGVVCRTGGDASTRNELLSLLSSAYGLPMTRIYISEAG